MKEIFKKHCTLENLASCYLPAHDRVVAPLVTDLVDHTKNPFAKGFAPMVLQAVRTAAEKMATEGSAALTVNAEQA